ncbi:alpha/beta fold hydrolase [Psychrobacter urativorans]|uniref:Methyltransferase n=1 Tax=Psychrobacter urativorans TaxID=45610 RepID=A0A0M4TDJ0_9GAMM|nr:alpha/beta fold hydrolase [Psychrobacter urativorans]ALF60208.1 hypothetical protein AOC03_09300 [Psychrobacter urativorans]
MVRFITLINKKYGVMSVYQLKSQFQNQLRPISNELVRLGVTANQITISAIVLSAGTAYLIATSAHYQRKHKVWWILPLSLFARMSLNAIDGMMAREHGQASQMGAILNEVGDIISDSLLIASLSPSLHAVFSEASDIYIVDFNHKHSAYSLSSPHSHLRLINGLSTLTELIAIFSNVSTSQRANHGPLGKSDRALELGLIGALVALGNHHYAHRAIHYIRLLFWLNEWLLIKTCFNRLSFIAHYYFDSMYPAPMLRVLNKQSKPLSASYMQQPIQGNAIMNNDLNINTAASPIIAQQSCFNAYDGTAIYYRYWLTMPLAEVAKRSAQAIDDPQKQVILLHRGHEHSGRLNELGECFAQAGYQVFAWDARGNGRSGGIKDHADSVTELERDLNDFVNLVIAQTGIAIENTMIIASSIGATLAAAWVHDYAPTIRGMILGTPAISIRLYLPLAIPVLKIARKFGLMSRVSSYVKAQVLTHDKAAQAAYNADPLISGSISSDLLIDTHATGQRLLDDASAITVPTFILCAGKDYVVDKQAERDFYDQLSAPIKRWQLYPDSFHAIFHETNKADIFADCIGFADSLFVQPVKTVDLTNAHQSSASKDKVDRLAIKPFNPNFAFTRFAMQKFGHVSDAIATGLEHGFDSGSSLDKVYVNTPNGKNYFGKVVDKFYLSNIGWQGIRIRREHLLELARIAIAKRSHADDHYNNYSTQSLRVLDIASGNGYYVFDLLAEFDSLHAELRDYDRHNVQVLTDRANELGVSERVMALEKDAFDLTSYTSIIADTAADNTNNLFDIAIASGIFELFSDNTLVSTALTGIHSSLAAGGYLLYTNQPWHPEQEFISKTLNNHRGSNWVMRCRSQAEMDQLVTQAGFTKLDMRIDRFGIFTVSLAVKQEMVNIKDLSSQSLTQTINDKSA